ncbi:hypothetical protein ACXR0O_08760 [Verrucomicrobiota bacterium sgz303538]
MSTPTPEDHANAIKEALFAGNKIQAIKLYRAQVNVGLAEAKNAVEKIEADLRASSPERFTSVPQGKGCFAVILIFLSISAGVVRLLP